MRRVGLAWRGSKTAPDDRLAPRLRARAHTSSGASAVAVILTGCVHTAPSPAQSHAARPVEVDKPRVSQLLQGERMLRQQIALPVSEAPAVAASRRALRIYVTERRLVLVGEQVLTVQLPDRATQAAEGVGRSNKLGPNDLRVIPLERSLRLIPDSKKESAIVFADAAVPYRILIEILFTLGQNGCQVWLLVTQSHDPSGLAEHGLRTTVPFRLGKSAATILIRKQGIAVKIGDGQAECGTQIRDVSAPASSSVGDGQLRTCLKALQENISAVVSETGSDPGLVFVAAELSTPYQEIVSTIDVARSLGFPRFGLQVMR